MNRRGFFKTLAAATAGFAILPPATTYSRIWKATYDQWKVQPYNGVDGISEFWMMSHPVYAFQYLKPHWPILHIIKTDAPSMKDQKPAILC